MTTLQAGDIAIVGMNTDAPDKVSFVILTDIDAGTEIKLTDNGVKADGTFRANEGTLVWQADQAIAAGTVINITKTDAGFTANSGTVTPESGSFALSASGDQVIAYQGDNTAPTFIAAVNAEGTGWQADATSSNTSALPTGLTNGVTAVAITESDNVAYTGDATSGSAETLLTAINNAENWSSGNTPSSAPEHPSENFTVQNYKTDLEAGDIAIVGINADSPDKVSFVILTDLAEGAEIKLTDNGVKADGTFRANEGVLTWAAAQNIPAGTVITIENADTAEPVTNTELGSVTVTDSGFNLSGGGDQVIAYQGTEDAPQFIYAVNNQGGDWQADATNSNASALPTGLTNGVNAVAINEIDNAAYAGVTAGSLTEILAAISDASNWVGTNSADTAPAHPASFSVTGGGTGGDDTTAPTLVSSTPADDSTDFAANADITLTFDENVTAGTGTFTLSDTTGTVVEIFDVSSDAVTFSGDTVTINPTADLNAGTAYTLTADATAVTDTAGNAWSPSFGDTTPTTLNFSASAAEYTLISTIQGEGDAGDEALRGQEVTIEGIITAYVPGKNGFYVQEQATDYDANPNTSEGIFVYYGDNPNPGVNEASIGDTVTLQGTVGNYRGNTQLSYTQNFTVTEDGTVEDLPEPVIIELPVATYGVMESHENMLVTVSSGTEDGSLVVTDNYNLSSYGQVTLTSDEVQTQYTETNAPSVDGFAAFNEATRVDQIILDDGLSSQNPEIMWGRNGEPLSADNTLRAGDSITQVTGVMEEFVDNRAGKHETSFRIQATQPEDVIFTGEDRPTAEQLQSQIGDAEIKVASVNVLNYFTTEGRDNFTTPFGNTQPGRGADNPEEFARQQTKLVDMLLGLDADVIGLMEIQNNGFGDDSALQALVDALNAEAGEGTYAFISGPFTDGTNMDVPAAGSGAITVGFIYKPANVTPVGQAAVPDTDTYDAFTATYGNRVPLAQTFESNQDGEQFTAVVNHFKSKGTEKDPDQLDGQGRNQEARELASQQLVDWLNTDPTGSNDPDRLLLGDFNAYSQEDAITLIDDNGYEKVSSGLSYSFDGLWGSLDHAFASDSMTSQVTGSAKWAINAEEPAILDYNTVVRDRPVQDIYAPDAYRSSDHNPILIGLNLGPDIPDDAIQGTSDTDFLRGTDESDVIYAFDGEDFIISRHGDDTIFAGQGDDVILSGGGNDTIDAGADNDWVLSGTGDDTINGGLGSDWLTGGRGKDTFVFDTKLGTDNIDTLIDFVSLEDVVHLDNSIFTKLTEGNLSAENFASNADGSAQDADDYVIYNTSTGTLSYDADGNGSGAAIEFAHVGYFSDITVDDIVVI